MNFEKDVERLRKENAILKDKLERVIQEKKEIIQEKNEIIQEKKKVEEEFEEFKAMHNKTVENLRKAMKIKADKKRKAKPLGAPKGHKGYARHIPEIIDNIKQLNPIKCPDCNTKLGKTQEIRHRHITDIKIISKPKTIRYDIHRKYCTKCKKIVEKPVPNVLPYARFGLNLMLLIMFLKLGLRLPGGKIVDYLLTMHNIKISGSEIFVVLKQLKNAFGDYYKTLEKMVKLARVKHSDTTGWRVNGKNYHVWVFIATGVVLYKIKKRNNHKAGLAVFGRKQQGNILVVDRHSALRKLGEEAGFLIQFCWSHIIKNSKDLARDFGADGKYVHRKLKQIYAFANSLDHRGNEDHIECLKTGIFQLTQRRYKSTTVRKFVNTLFYKDINTLFRFVTDPEVDSTNNISERELREIVIIRKISNGSRSRRGANATALLLSIIQTLRMNKENVLEGLQSILKNTSGY